MQIKIKATVPKSILNDKEVMDSIAMMMKQKNVPEVKSLFRKTTNGWDNAPYWLDTMKRTTNYLSDTIYPGGENADQYALVNHGAKIHDIPKSGTTFMRFQPGYTASTTPRVLKSGPKQRSGNYVTAYKIKNHPGFKAREFDKTIAKEYTPTFRKDVATAIKSAAAKAASPSNQETL